MHCHFLLLMHKWHFYLLLHFLHVKMKRCQNFNLIWWNFSLPYQKQKKPISRCNRLIPVIKFKENTTKSAFHTFSGYYFINILIFNIQYESIKKKILWKSSNNFFLSKNFSMVEEVALHIHFFNINTSFKNISCKHLIDKTDFQSKLYKFALVFN